ncbi:ATPase [Methylosinus sporium]|uniref:ATPase n=1 Tax=Methylosinus sporium TaxID=428 RepID=A0A549SLM1_METSR|nr:MULTISPECIES: ATP12 family protein [Methylosinus]MBU3887856.1 ATPase [Methylosinus sp. KRF6]TRL30457.1 ATPase [Methylosinus sporium]
MSHDSENLADGLFVPDEERNPLRNAVQRGARPELPKRFYQSASVGEAEGGYAVLLDGRTVKTPARRILTTPSSSLTTALAEEWGAQGERLNPTSMPLTRLVNSAIDGVSDRLEEVAADVAKYAGSDLVSYRAEEPAGLVAAQAEAWDPLLAFAKERLGAELAVTSGVMFVSQAPEATAAITEAVRAYAGQGADAPFRLAALHAMTTLTGSCLIALAVALGEMEVEAAWAAAHVDEDHQIEAWGADAEAMERRARRFAEMKAAARIIEFFSGAA